MSKAGSNIDQGYPDLEPEGPKKKKGFLIWLVIVVVSIIIATFFIIGFGGRSSTSNGSTRETYTGGGNTIAMLQIQGTITGNSESDYFGNPVGYQHKWTMDQIKRLMTEDNNKGILLYVNSGGGNVYESQELYDRLMEYREKTGRPVYTYMANSAASGAYLISLASDKIHANQNTLTGSIGVYVGPLMDVSGLLEKIGVKMELVKSGKNKAMGSVYTPATEEQLQIYQDYVDEAYEGFLHTVMERRNMEESKARVVCDGRFYTAIQAKKNGLIDEISSYEETVAAMMKENEGLENCTVNQITYRSKRSIVNLFSGIFGLMKESVDDFGKSELEIALELVEDADNYTLKYGIK